MGIQVFEIESKFYNQLKNGELLDQNAGSYTTNLVGSVMGKYRTIKKINIEWFSQASSFDSFTTSTYSGSLKSMKRTIGNFKTDGFAIGDTFDLVGSSGSVIHKGTISTISPDGKEILYTWYLGSFAEATYTDVVIRGTTDLTSLQYKFGLIENSDTFNTLNYVTTEDQGYYLAGVSSTYQPMIPLGSYRSWVTGNCQVRKNANPSTYIQQFQIDHSFVIPYYKEGEEDNLKNNIVPEILEGGKSLKHVYELEVRTVLSNPMSSKLAKIESVLGSVAYFNENFNGFNNQYSVDSITYSDVSNNLSDGILTNGRTKIKAVIKGDSFDNGNDKVVVNISKLASQTEVTNKTNTFESNFIYDSVLVTIGGGSTIGTGGFIKKLEAVYVDNQTIEVLFETEYSFDEQLRLFADSEFLIGIQVADNSLDSGNSNAVTLSIVGQYDLDADIPGLIKFNNINIFEYPSDMVLGYTSSELCIEDTIAIHFDFDLDLSKQAFLNSFKGVLLAYNNVTKQFFQLDEFRYDLSNGVVSNGIQQLNVSTTRGYQLKSGSEFNKIELKTGVKTGDKVNYTGILSQRIRWEEWIKVLNADTIFFDNTKPNNNLNANSSNYSNKQDYNIVLAFRSNVRGISELGRVSSTDYLTMSPSIRILNYGESSGWIGTVKTYDPDTLVDLGGAVLSHKNTLYRVTWNTLTTPFTSASDYWCKHYIQAQTIPPYELGNLETGFENNLLIPIQPLDRLKLELVGSSLVSDCLVDYTKVNQGEDYILSARLKVNEDIVIEVKATEEDEIKTTEIGEIKIPE